MDTLLHDVIRDRDAEIAAYKTEVGRLVSETLQAHRLLGIAKEHDMEQMTEIVALRTRLDEFVEAAIKAVSDLPLGYRTEDEHAKLENFADRACQAIAALGG